MKTLDIIAQANSNLLRSKARTFLTILAIFIGSFTIILSSAINSGVNDFIDRQVESIGGEGYIEIMPAAIEEQIANLMGGSSDPIIYNPDSNSSEISYLSDKTIAKIKEIDHIKPESVRPFLSANAEYITSEATEEKYKIRVQAMPSETLNIDMVEGKNIDIDGDLPEIALPDNYAKVLGYDSNTDIVGKTVVIGVKDSVTGKISEISATVSGIQAPGIISMGRSWINEVLNQKMLEVANANLPAEYANKTMYATAEYDPTITSEELDKLREDFAALKLSISTTEDQAGMIRTFFDVILIVFSIFGGIALLAAAIGIVNTLLMSVSDRTREIGLMKAMGLSSFKVFLSFAFEAISLGFWSSLIGTGVAMAVGFAANSAFHAPGGFLETFPTFSLVSFTPSNILSIFIIIMLIAFLAGTLPAIRAARKNPIDALRYE